ncbi:Crp/Fnr family transcriptional regulator [Anaerotignum sp.]|nr:Crp/Fnr family transcriptional regulator [Anaerotignum sp.]MBP3306356.1 Crp/Fnr family transcriptional regulator [Anaerotignum sp.]MBP3628967.1 Crp/Fnr family transcriptional regulator [Anaerotignum sp.]
MENISKNALFQNVSAESIEKMIPCFDMKKRSFSEKDIIPTSEGTKEYVCLLLEGAVSVSRISIDGSLDLLEYLEDSGVFGDAFAFANREDEFITVCEKDCSVLYIEKSHITKRCSNACQHHTQVVENMLQLMSNKVVHLTEKVDILSHRSIRGKLMSYFRIQSTKQNNLTFELPFSLLKLANYLCIDRSAMMRELKKMKEEEMIELDGRMVTLL